MTLREKIYYTFYSVAFLTSIFFGIKSGFTDTHTPPMPFFISLMVCLIGVVFLIIDTILGESKKVHLIGLSANFAIIALVIVAAF